MALTDAQRVKVRRYIGWAFNYSGGIDRLDTTLDGLTSAQSDEIAGILTQIATLDASLVTASTEAAGIIQVEEIKWAAGGRLIDARSERTRLIGDLASLLGVSGNTPGNGPVMRG